MYSNQNRGCGFSSTCLTTMNRCALESPDRGECSKYPHYHLDMPRKIFYGPLKVRRSHFFVIVGRWIEISEMKFFEKNDFLKPKNDFFEIIFKTLSMYLGHD